MELLDRCRPGNSFLTYFAKGSMQSRNPLLLKICVDVGRRGRRSFQILFRGLGPSLIRDSHRLRRGRCCLSRPEVSSGWDIEFWIPLPVECLKTLNLTKQSHRLIHKLLSTQSSRIHFVSKWMKTDVIRCPPDSFPSHFEYTQHREWNKGYGITRWVVALSVVSKGSDETGPHE